MSEEVKELLDKLGSMEDAPLIWINQRVETLITENKQLKDRINKANNLTKRIKDDMWVKMAECYENEDNWNGDFLNTEINSIDRLLDLLKGDKE